jgi:hypothetical protein
MQCNRFLALDFGGLQTEEDLLLQALGRRDGVEATIKKSDGDAKLMLLAYLAARFVKHSRAAQRFAKRVLDHILGWDFVDEIDSHIFALNSKDS